MLRRHARARLSLRGSSGGRGGGICLVGAIVNPTDLREEGVDLIKLARFCARQVWKGGERGRRTEISEGARLVLGEEGVGGGHVFTGNRMSETVK